MTESAVIFLHISKTGGTTLRSIIQRQYRAEHIYDLDPSYFTSDAHLYEDIAQVRLQQLRQVSEADKRQLYCFFHPRGYGIHEIIPQPTQYLTLLRDPIDRYISSYYFAVNMKGHILHDELKAQGITLESMFDHYPVDNLQTRRLSGVDDATAPLPDDALERARHNLRHNIRVVGLLDRFDESVLLMQDAFGWDDVRYVRKNVAPRRRAVDSLPPTLRERLEEALAPDMTLYRDAQAIFEEQLATYDKDVWHARVRDLQQASNRYRQITHLKRRLRRIPAQIKQLIFAEKS